MFPAASSVTATEHLSGILSTMVIQAKQLIKVPSEEDGGVEVGRGQLKRHACREERGEKERMKKRSGLAYRPLQLEH